MTHAAIQTDPRTNGRLRAPSTELSLLSPEAEIVLLCSRRELNDAQLDRVSYLLARTSDIEHLFSLAHRNGVTPLLCNNLLQEFSPDLTPEARETATGMGRQHALRNMSMTGKLLEILRIFETAGVSAVPFKGPTLAMRLYQTTTLRQFIDLDILVLPRDFERAVDALLAHGYEFLPESGPMTRDSFRVNRKKDVSLIHPDDNYRIELHWRLSGSFFSMPLHLNQLWRRMETTTLAGVRVSTLPFKDLFVYLCLHAARHGFERLEWISDLNELILTERDPDWEAIRKHARIHGCERVVELALFLVVHFFGTRPNYPELSRIESDASFSNIAVTVRDRLFTDAAAPNGIGDWYGYHLMLKEKRTDRIKLHMFYLVWYFKLIFRPNSVDKATFALPASFYPLYYILRPARLLYNYLSKQAPTR